MIKYLKLITLVSASIWGTAMAKDEQTVKEVQRVEVIENPFRMPTFEESLKQAEEGDALSQLLVGNAYQDGNGTTKNTQEAIKWYSRAADQGLDLAMISLGEIYKTGDGTDKNYELALEWYQKAVDQDSHFGLTMLGSAYLEGVIIERDYDLAYNYFLRAANNLEFFAHLQLGIMEMEGLGREKDYVKAYMWFENAMAGLDLEQGYEEAERFQKEISSKMTPEEIEKAKQLAIEWAETYG